ncbi:hypothetical protein K1T71_005255 [Dendrolimus kikuchii]|uniref:Uncharacterized protein n=1 Tax=Dendrolimus kikuchii TaxID=765133 RepID=A0ACC1D6K4_9NEOP|nr:hypothetical protein K1T71_005255 [Dendrolimus kikuchii]
MGWLYSCCCISTELDLLGALSLHNTSRVGISVEPGMQPQRTAYNLQGDLRALQVEGDTFERAAELLRRSPEFTVLATLKQDPANAGTIISFSHGYNRYLEVQSSGRRDEVRLHYVAAGGSAPRVETFPFRLADGAWHRLALTVSGAQATLLVDCHPLYRRLIPPPDRNFTQPQLALWIGQRNSKHSLFKGTLQEVRLVSGPHGYLAQCPGLDSECPTCGQFALLQATVQELTTHIHDLSLKLVGAEARLARLEKCDCQKSCYSNGTVHADGATWQEDCDKCSCVHGEITCRPVDCTRADCKKPVMKPRECCPKCLKQCFLQNTLYEHGERFSPKECAECVCHDGIMQCTRKDPSVVCPPLSCDPAQQFTVPGECCKFCPGVDYCSIGHECDENATCMNLNTKYMCKCNQGFQGDGITCEDVDECQEAGGLNGHHCHSNTRCVNVLGGYVCQCLPGYTRRDKFNCIEMDECTEESHGCHSDAVCTNTPGSYTCRCREGYEGDGYTCTPVCTGGCLNGGECAAPERCACAAGFEGQRCERDADECAAIRSPCPAPAICVNTPGSYYCVCAQGYTKHPNHHICQDVDECAEGFHTCHPSARCVNVDGGFLCECDNDNCELSCAWQGRVMEDGAQWREDGGCVACACKRGVAACRRAPCACDFATTHSHNASATLATFGSTMPSVVAPPSCCPHCEARYHCRHQEMHHVTFRSGERWLYQCQICECLLGEVDCWEPDCEEAGGCCMEGAGRVEGEGTEGEGGTGRPHRLQLAGCAPPHCPDCQGGQCATLRWAPGGVGVGAGAGGALVGAGARPRGAPQAPRRAALEPP